MSQYTYLVTDLDLVTTPRRQKNLVTRLHGRRNNLSILVRRTRTSSDHRRFRERRRCRRGRQEQTRSGLCLRLEPLDKHTVEQRDNRLDRTNSRGLYVSTSCLAPLTIARGSLYNACATRAFCRPGFGGLPPLRPKPAIFCAIRRRSTRAAHASLLAVVMRLIGTSGNSSSGFGELRMELA